VDTFGADVFAFVERDVARVAAEDTRRLILFQHDGVVLDENLQRIIVFDLEGTPQFDGENETPDAVDSSHDSG
jgi:translation initiation factor RLI1